MTIFDKTYKIIDKMQKKKVYSYKLYFKNVDNQLSTVGIVYI